MLLPAAVAAFHNAVGHVWHLDLASTTDWWLLAQSALL
jgi:hypothetical protein